MKQFPPLTAAMVSSGFPASRRTRNLNASELAWLSDYMEPVRTEVELRRLRDALKVRVSELEAFNRDTVTVRGEARAVSEFLPANDSEPTPLNLRDVLLVIGGLALVPWVVLGAILAIGGAK